MLSIGKAWDETKAALSGCRRQLVPLSLGLVLLPATIAAMVQPRVPAGEQPPLGAWTLVMLAAVIAMIAGQMAIVLLANGWRGSLGEALARAARRVPTMLLAVLMIATAAVALMIVVLALIGLGTGGDGRFDPASLNGFGWALILAVTGLMLFISVRLLVLMPVIAEGSEGALASIRRSWAMTRGNFWKLLGFLVLMLLIFLVIALAAGAVVGSAVTLALGKPEPWSVSLLLLSLASGLVQAGFVLVYTAMLARIAAQLSPAAPARAG